MDLERLLQTGIKKAKRGAREIKETIGDTTEDIIGRITGESKVERYKRKAKRGTREAKEAILDTTEDLSEEGKEALGKALDYLKSFKETGEQLTTRAKNRIIKILNSGGISLDDVKKQAAKGVKEAKEFLINFIDEDTAKKAKKYDKTQEEIDFLKKYMNKE